MWKNPRYYPPEPEPPAPPEPSGHLLAELSRGRGEVLRIVLDEYEGHRHVGLRVWAPGPDGRLLPVKGKGYSIRVRELADAALAPRRAGGLVEGRGAGPGGQGGPLGGHPSNRGPSDPGRRDGRRTPLASGPAERYPTPSGPVDPDSDLGY